MVLLSNDPGHMIGIALDYVFFVQNRQKSSNKIYRYLTPNELQ